MTTFTFTFYSKLSRGPGGTLSKDSAIELFDLNHKVSVGGVKALNVHNVTEEELKTLFRDRCDAYGNIFSSKVFIDCHNHQKLLDHLHVLG